MIELYVSGQNLKITTPVVAADSLSYLRARVHFTDGSWDGLSRWLHFKRGETVYDYLLSPSGRIAEEDELNLTAGEWTVYLTGSGDGRRATTVTVILTVKESGLVDAPLHEIPQNVAEQLAAGLEAAWREIRMLKRRAGLVILGFKPDLETLEDDVPEPLPGDAYAVGTEAPYDVYIWNDEMSEWVDAGPFLESEAQGPAGTTFFPAVDEAGNISWTNDGGRTNPTTRNIMGRTGATGARGPAGKSAYETARDADPPYEGEEEVFNAALAAMPYHAARHLPSGADPITVKTDNIEDGAVTGEKLASDAVQATKVYTITVGTGDAWSGSSAPYTMRIAVDGLRESDRVIADVVLSNTVSTAQQEMDAYGSIYKMVTEDGYITLYATSKTTTGLTIQLMAVML